MSALVHLEGKVAVVTGGASGIGRGIAARLLAHGMHVVVAGIEREALERTAKALGATGIVTDVGSRDSVFELADEVQRRFGTVHVVCNNAGVGSVARIDSMTIDDWRWLIDVNLWGVIHGVEAFLPLLQRNEDGGHVVNTASMGGLSTLPRLGGYAVTKFAVVALTETLAAELEEEGSRVGVTLLCPGPVRTNIRTSQRNRAEPTGPRGLVDTDLESSPEGAAMRWLDPEEVGELVVHAIRAGDLYAFTHPEMAEIPAARHERIAAAFRAAAQRSD